jgi:hypothetical protein
MRTKVGERLIGLKHWYFGYLIRNESTGQEHSGKLRCTAVLASTALADALEQVRQSFNGEVKIYRDDRVTCQLTDLQTQQSGWYQCRIGEHWTSNF